MPPEEMTGSTHILEFMCYANSRFRRDKIPHGNGDVIFFRCFGSATPETDGGGPVVFQIGFWPPRDRLWFAPLFLATVVIRFCG